MDERWGNWTRRGSAGMAPVAVETRGRLLESVDGTSDSDLVSTSGGRKGRSVHLAWGWQERGGLGGVNGARGLVVQEV